MQIQHQKFVPALKDKTAYYKLKTGSDIKSKPSLSTMK